MATATFVVSYVWLMLVPAGGRPGYVLAVYALSLAIAIAIALTVADRSGWGFLFTYCGAVTAILAPTPGPYSSASARASGWPAACRCSVALLVGGATGLEAAEELQRSVPSCRVLILTTFGRPGYLRRAMEGGAAGFLLKHSPAEQLATAIRRAMAGERVVDPGLAAAPLSEGESPLTPREHEVLVASRRYATVAELAGALFLSAGTVRNHLSSAMRTRARNRAEAVRVAEEKGWLGGRREPALRVRVARVSAPVRGLTACGLTACAG